MLFKVIVSISKLKMKPYLLFIKNAVVIVLTIILNNIAQLRRLTENCVIYPYACFSKYISQNVSNKI